MFFYCYYFCSDIAAKQGTVKILSLSSNRYGLRDLLTNDCLRVLSGYRREHQTHLGGEKKGALCKRKKARCFPSASR